MMEANVLNFLAACAMAHDWGMEELSFISHADGTLEMEGNYSLKLHDAGWGGYPSQQDFAAAKAAWDSKGPWPFKPTVVYDDSRNILFEAGY